MIQSRADSAKLLRTFAHWRAVWWLPACVSIFLHAPSASAAGETAAEQAPENGAARSATAPGAQTKTSRPASSNSPAAPPNPSAVGAETQSPPEATPGAPNADSPGAEAPTAEQQQAAEQALSEGKIAYTNGDYLQAAELFSRAHELAPSPQAQYWLAMSLDLQGKPSEAYQAFQELLANPHHGELDVDLLQAARQRSQVLAKIPATVVVTTTPAEATLAVGGTVQPGPSPFTLKLPAGEHQLEIRAEGFETSQVQLDLTPAQSLEHDVTLVTSAPQAAVPEATPVESAAEAAATSPAPRERNRTPAYVTLGVAGASAIVGSIFGIQALNAENDFDDNPTTRNADTVERNALIADMAWGVAITLGITGVVLLTTDEPQPQEAGRSTPERSVAKSVRVAPYVTPTGGGAAARLTF